MIYSIKRALGLSLLFIGFIANSQLKEIPNVNILKSSSEFRKLDVKVINTLKWLSSSESFSDKRNRKEHIAFVSSFLDKNPYLVYSPSKSLVKFRKRSEYNTQFKLGWMNYLLSYEYSKNNVENHYEAFTHVIEFYSAYKKEFGRNSYIEKLMKLKQDKQLRNYIKTNI